MPNFYIYTASYKKENLYNEQVPCSVTILFCDRDNIEEANLQYEIKQFYETNYQTDEIFVIGGECNFSRLNEVFIEKQLETFKDIPKLQADHLAESVFLFTFNQDGKLQCRNKKINIHENILSTIINQGLIYIFKQRGGIIEATGGAHHFVFPSGKHCNKFLRTGNILLHSSEIYFIAFCLLPRLRDEEHKQIFCDTSSINTLAFALLDLKKKLLGDAFKSIPIKSFSSYEGLFSKTVRFFNNSLILVSASTSGNIINEIIQHDESVNTANIVILYFLGSDKNYKKHHSHIVCNLTNNKSNTTGFDLYDTYSDSDCVYCKEGSYPVEIKGDIFLLEKPKINKVTINVTDAPKKLSNFVQQFKSKDRKSNILKVNYKENSQLTNKYEIYFDMHYVLTEIQNSTTGKAYSEYKKKLFDYINQYIPSNTKYLITLPDEGSEKLGEIILNQIKQNYKPNKLPQLVRFDDVLYDIKEESIEGSAVIIGSCISNGKNLLYLSRTLRPFEKLRLVYFIGLTRSENLDYLNFLKSNLKQGLYGKETNSFIEVENFFMTKDSKNTSWVNEKDFLADITYFIEDKNMPLAKVHFSTRIELINNSQGNLEKGLANNLFYPNTSGEQLSLRKGFAFFNFSNYVSDVSQADVYFTISSVLNNLRNVDEHVHCLKQSEYVRNVIDPGNFNRFNDGIIQASILRSAKAGELSYNIDENLSSKMKSILDKIIDEHRSPQGEALLEFLYALATKKLLLKKEHLFELTIKLDEIKNIPLIEAFNLIIKNYVLANRVSLLDQIDSLQKENRKLKSQISKN